MSRLADLIRQLCPDGVPYKTLGEVLPRVKGTPITAGKMKEIATPNGDIRIFAGGKTVIDTELEKIPNANIINKPAILVQSRGVIDFIYYDKPFTFKNEMWAYIGVTNVSLKFIYYVLKSNVDFFRNAASGMGSLPQISLHVTEDFRIPVPPLPVQEEIVRILDAFTTLEAELEAELEARRRQYEYYREKLLTFGDDVPRVDFSKCCKLIRGDYITKHDATIGPYPVILGGQEPAYHINKYNHTGSAIVISRSGASAGFVSYWNEPIFVTDGFIIENLSNANIRFLFFLFKTWQAKMNSAKRGGGVPHITGSYLSSLSIPLPPLSEQSRIVGILDRFDTLCNDLCKGLPAEIAARHKQYEYYRDRLLSFKEAKG